MDWLQRSMSEGFRPTPQSGASVGDFVGCQDRHGGPLECPEVVESQEYTRPQKRGTGVASVKAVKVPGRREGTLALRRGTGRAGR